MFDVVNEGTLFAIWAEDAPSGQVVAFFSPNKPVPPFKYTPAGSKTEIMRKFRGNKARFFQGFAQFFKLAKDYEGECLLLTTSVGVFWRNAEDAIIMKFTPGADEERVLISRASALAVLPAANDSMTAGSSLMQELFLRIGQNEGGGIAL